MKIISPWKILNYVFKLYIRKDPVIISHRKWIKDKGEQLRLDYKLSKDSVVFDIGGYKGNWTSDIYNKYNCKVFVFEPIKKFSEEIRNRFRTNNKILVHDYGISDSNEEAKISLFDNGSSVIHDWNTSFETINLVDIVDFIRKNNITKVDLMKINVEGGEYKILNRLINSDYIKICKNLQIQFHSFVDNANTMRDEIQSKLSNTHHLTYEYPWIWENWELNEEKGNNIHK